MKRDLKQETNQSQNQDQNQLIEIVTDRPQLQLRLAQKKHSAQKRKLFALLVLASFSLIGYLIWHLCR
ncbi:MAG: hypothetical protein ACRC10_08740 [Thermoguttaceae bacterium]